MNDEYEDYNDEDELDNIEIKVEVAACTLKLDKDVGFMIKELIRDNYPHTFPHYCAKTGISTPNFYNTLNGERPCSLVFLNKLLSGINYQAIISDPAIRIVEMKTGEIVNAADFILPEIESQSIDEEDQDM